MREFYSFHFGNDMRFTRESLNLREKYLTPEFERKLSARAGSGDPFTTGDEDLPKAFRVGECREIGIDKVEFQVLLFWRDDVRSEQREVRVEAVRSADRWLINGVSSAQAP